MVTPGKAKQDLTTGCTIDKRIVVGERRRETSTEVGDGAGRTSFTRQTCPILAGIQTLAIMRNIISVQSPGSSHEAILETSLLTYYNTIYTNDVGVKWLDKLVQRRVYNGTGFSQC